MFEQTFVDAARMERRAWPVLFSFTGQILLVAIALLIPLLRTADLLAPKPIPIFLPLSHHEPKPVVQTEMSRPKALPALRPLDPKVLIAPHKIPATVSLIDDLPAADPLAKMSGLGNGTGVFVTVPGLDTIGPSTEPPPKPRPVEASKPMQQVRVSAGVQAAKLIDGPKPAYPPLARTARVSGIVHLQAIVGRDGHIQNLQVLSGHPLLVQSAIEAVKRWVYQPTTLNGDPVEVITQIDVNFTLSQ